MPLPIYRKHACQTFAPLSQSTALALMDKKGGAYKMISALSLSEWKVLSFDPYNKKVCIELLAKPGANRISVNLNPELLVVTGNPKPQHFQGRHPEGPYHAN
jgi:hypothetical protein